MILIRHSIHMCMWAYYAKIYVYLCFFTTIIFWSIPNKNFNLIVNKFDMDYSVWLENNSPDPTFWTNCGNMLALWMTNKVPLLMPTLAHLIIKPSPLMLAWLVVIDRQLLVPCRTHIGWATIGFRVLPRVEVVTPIL